ncbi:hypothetical protein AC792_02455 [Arthrobacter sp. RIT-PI-e]|uniref:LysR family transcriptional regulator ArgP n=1 Tax=Arthrobacter sp. RIT-PI-e TaxID=1681197 RepID=UPI000675D900|nr:LysR family transcriptional regulator ArgP [Arthrobacter sp. RIT-PI-e]KNC20155.1 hypothetical protein AC792_02455 [Arthrobacter sp. RIT-PI-e]
MFPFQHEHLETLIALVDHGSFDAAAAELHMSASAVSQRVKAMEARCGTALVRRTLPVGVTPAGETLLRTARQIQRLQHDALEELGLPGSGVRTEIPVVVNPDSFAAWFLDVMAAVHDETGATFTVHLEAEQHSADHLHRGTVMAAVTATPRPVQGCTVSTLGTMRYRAVATPAVVARHGGVEKTLAALDQIPVLVFDRADDLQHRFVREHLGRTLASPAHYVPASAQYTEALLQDLGWGLLTDPFCRQELDRGTLVELAPGVELTVPLYWQRWRIDSPLMDLVTRTVERAASRVLQPVP